jgi:hypothetical protein
MAKKKKGSKKIEEKEFDLPEGLELLETNGWGNKIFSWIKNNFSAIILPIIALVILGGGIYLYSQQKGEGIDINEADLESGIVIDLEEDEKAEDEKIEGEEKIEEEKEIEVADEKAEIAAEEEEKTEEKRGLFGRKKEQKKDAEEKIIIKDAFKESALGGDGITHLARRALKSYLQSETITLSAEQKVFAEDYIQNQTGTRMLDKGEALTFSRSLIEDAVSQAQQLNATQIQNLKQYASLVPSLNY